MSKIMDKSLEAVNVYNKIAEKYTKIFFNDFSDIKELDYFLSLLPKRAKILDIGCGPGNFTKYFISKGFDSEGIDLSSEMIKIAKIKVPEGRFKIMDLRRLDYPSNQFDGLIAADSFMHIPKRDAKKALLGFKKVLKPNGLLFFIVKEGKGERFLIEPLNPKEKCYIKLWQLSEIIDLFKKCKFEIIFKSEKKSEVKEELKYNKMFLIARKL